jgi:hypothetical protein
MDEAVLKEKLAAAKKDLNEWEKLNEKAEDTARMRNMVNVSFSIIAATTIIACQSGECITDLSTPMNIGDMCSVMNVNEFKSV